MSALARPEIVVDLAAIRHNVRTLAELVAVDGARMMTVVKADGYGHGLVESGRAARAAGADWLGVATVSEALTLRTHGGDTGRLLCWLTLPADLADRCSPRHSRSTSTSRRTRSPASTRSSPRASRSACCLGSSSRSTPGSPAAGRPSTAWA